MGRPFAAHRAWGGRWTHGPARLRSPGQARAFSLRHQVISTGLGEGEVECPPLEPDTYTPGGMGQTSPPFSANPASPLAPSAWGLRDSERANRVGFGGAAARRSRSPALSGRGAVQPLVLKLEARIPRGDFQQPILTPEVGTGRARALPSPTTTEGRGETRTCLHQMCFFPPTDWAPSGAQSSTPLLSPYQARGRG